VELQEKTIKLLGPLFGRSEGRVLGAALLCFRSRRASRRIKKRSSLREDNTQSTERLGPVPNKVMIDTVHIPATQIQLVVPRITSTCCKFLASLSILG